jgi:hypothetical protein
MILFFIHIGTIKLRNENPKEHYNLAMKASSVEELLFYLQ